MKLSLVLKTVNNLPISIFPKKVSRLQPIKDSASKLSTVDFPSFSIKLWIICLTLL